MNIKNLLFVSVLTLLLSTPAMASDWQAIGVHVTLLEATYMPQQVTFRVDANAGNCTAGAYWLIWNGHYADPPANAKAVYALLLAAQLSGKTINIWGNNKKVGPGPDPSHPFGGGNVESCEVVAIHLQ